MSVSKILNSPVLFFLFALVLVAILTSFSLNSYGTSDIHVQLEWAQKFTTSGYWQNYLTLANYFFNTTVHSNHLIAALFLSAAQFALSPSRRFFLLYVFLSFVTFLDPFSVVLIFVLGGYLGWATYRLLCFKSDYLGLA